MGRWPGDAEKQKTSFGDLNRSQLMSRIRSSGNITTEKKLEGILRSSGLKGWRRKWPLEGKPDFVWPRYKVVVFVDGCFWHGHKCRNLSPKTNVKAWTEKIEKNKKRDKYVSRTLRNKGWSVVRIWECKLDRNPDFCLKRIKDKLDQNGYQDQS